MSRVSRELQKTDRGNREAKRPTFPLAAASSRRPIRISLRAGAARHRSAPAPARPSPPLPAGITSLSENSPRSSRSPRGRRTSTGGRDLSLEVSTVISSAEPLAETQLRALLGHTLSDLGLVPPLTPHDLCRSLGRQRVRDLELRERDLPPGVASGLLLSYANQDVIVYQRLTTPAHQAHIIFHEVVHLIRGHLDHNGGSVCEALLAHRRDGRPGTLYGQWQEQEAETGATILSGWADTATASTPIADASTRRLGAALGCGVHWS